MQLQPIKEHFLNITYLCFGNDRQKQAYWAIRRSRVFDILPNSHLILAGTIPIGVDIPSSDLDLIGQTSDFRSDHNRLLFHYSEMRNFEIMDVEVKNERSLICRFHFEEFDFEIFLQGQSALEQNAVRHMLIESRILNLANDSFRKQIVDLKNKGVKTEPAFAQMLNLEGDPYLALLELESYDEFSLKRLVSTKIKKGPTTGPS